MKSIRRHLLYSLLTGLVVCTVITAGVAYIFTTDELHEFFDDNLRRMAIIIKGEAFLSAQVKDSITDIDTAELEESYVIQVWKDGSKPQLSSRPDINLPLQPHEGLNRIKIDDQLWEIYTLKADGLGYVQIAQPQKIVATIIGESAARAMLPLILLFVFLVTGAWYVVGRSLLPLVALSKTIARWDTDNMRPLAIEDAPDEIQPSISALNGMLSKLDKAISLQRQFTADAAHELRTPLTAIKLQLDNVARAPSAATRQEAVQKLSDGIDRCIHLASQLLIASRSMAVKTDPEFQIVYLNEIIRSSMTTFAVLASNKRIEMSFDYDGECRILGNEEELRVLTNNLLDNAVRYTPEGGIVVVRLFRETGALVLEVIDDGPGIPKDERQKTFQRFYRIPGTVSVGSGLGLSIVKTIAETHGAVVRIYDGFNQKGTTMRVAFRS